MLLYKPNAVLGIRSWSHFFYQCSYVILTLYKVDYICKLKFHCLPAYVFMVFTCAVKFCILFAYIFYLDVAQVCTAFWWMGCWKKHFMLIFLFLLFLHVSKSQQFFPIWIPIVLIYQIWEISRTKLKKSFCYQELFWPFTVWINCSSDLKYFANSRPSASNFKHFSRSLKHFFLTVGQNTFGNKIPFFSVTLEQLLSNPWGSLNETLSDIALLNRTPTKKANGEKISAKRPQY